MANSRFYPGLCSELKANAFDVLDYFSNNRKAFDGLHFTAAFGKLYDECQFLGLSEDDLARAVDITLTLEQRRMNSYSSGNTHIEDYSPGQVKPWTDYMPH